MDRQFINSVCRGCPHSRLVGEGRDGPQSWRVELCLHAVDNAHPLDRPATPVGELRTMDECPDTPRAMRARGGA